MTWARIKATGRGRLKARLSIEGIGYEFVTHSDMVTTAADGRERVYGLSIDGVKLTQRADLIGAKIDAMGAQFRVTDYGGKATLAFAGMPTLSTWMTADTTAAATSGIVLSSTSWPTSGRIWIDSEVIEYSSRLGDNEFNGFTRGVWDTLAQSHYAPDGAFLRYPEVSNGPTVLSGKRVRLFVYGEGDSPTGDGTQAWLGMMASDPRMDGPAWTILVDPISRVLEQEVGGDLGDPVTPRGVYLPGGLSLQLRRVPYSSGATTALPEPGLVPDSNGALIELAPAFFETQQDFLAALQTQIDAAISGWAGIVSISALPDERTGAYRFEVQTGTSQDGVRIQQGSTWFGCEPSFDGLMQNAGAEHDSRNGVNAMGASTTYFAFPKIDLSGAGAVPRGVFNRSRNLGGMTPFRRVYLGGTTSVSNLSVALVKWVKPDGEVDSEHTISALSTSDRYIELAGGDIRGDETVAYTPDLLPEIRLGREYSAYPSTGVYNLLKTIEEDCPDFLNTGAMPMLQAGDWDSAAVLAAYDGASALATGRKYSTLKSVKLIDFVAPDLQLAGLHLAIDSSGKLTVKRTRLGSATELTTFSITASNLITDEGLPVFERGAVGQYAELVLRDGYDPIEDKTTLMPVRVRDVAAYGRNPMARSIVIEPKSAPLFGRVANEDVVELASRILGVFGGPYSYVTVVVPLTAFDVVIGDAVSITTTHMPSSDGTRGVTDLVGIVTARSVDLYGARIELTALVSNARIAGYAPSCVVSTQTNTGGDKWAITIDTALFTSGDTVDRHFVEEDRVQVYRYDSATAGTVQGIVTGVNTSSNIVNVNFDAAWTPGADEWVLTHDDSDVATATSNQRRYAIQASSIGIIDWDPDPDTAARVFAP